MNSRYLVIVAAMLFAVARVQAADPQPAEPGKPGSGRWQIHAVVYGLTNDSKIVSRSENTILLDTETGKTWLFWPTKDVPAGYSWIELIQRKDAAKAPSAQ